MTLEELLKEFEHAIRDHQMEIQAANRGFDSHADSAKKEVARQRKVVAKFVEQEKARAAKKPVRAITGRRCK